MNRPAGSFNPFLPGFTDDPYPHYADLRATTPIEVNPIGFWALWRHRGVSSGAVRSLEPAPREQAIRDIVRAQRGLVQLATEAIAWKRTNPADDMLTALINAEDSGDVLSPEELVAQVILLYVAGHET